MKVLKYDCFRSGVTAFSTERDFNINQYCGDTAEHIKACRAELCEWLNIADRDLVMPHQTHGTVVAEIDNSETLEGVDAVMTARRGVCIGVSTADCIPVLLHDARHDAVCAIHSGWRGTVKHITAKALEAMRSAYGTLPCDVVAAIGPGIRVDAFEVGDEVYDAFREAGFRDIYKKEKKWHIDLVGAVKADLAGVSKVYDCALCTHTLHERFFSARRHGINSGRIFTGIILS